LRLDEVTQLVFQVMLRAVAAILLTLQAEKP
jgi:hypothetical protein